MLSSNKGVQFKRTCNIESKNCTSTSRPSNSKHGQSGATNSHPYYDKENLKYKKFKCTHCDKRFKRPEHRKTHVRTIHFTDHSNKCDQCEKVFTQKGNLKTHIATVHKKERQYSCSQCQKAFAQKIQREVHISAVHFKEKKFRCHLCDCYFSQVGNLKVHLSKMHP